AVTEVKRERRADVEPFRALLGAAPRTASTPQRKAPHADELAIDAQLPVDERRGILPADIAALEIGFALHSPGQRLRREMRHRVYGRTELLARRSAVEPHLPGHGNRHVCQWAYGQSGR